MSVTRLCSPSNPRGKPTYRHELRNPRPSVRTREELNTVVRETDKRLAPWKALNSLRTGMKPLWR